MTNLRINTPEALKRFFEILAEESVYSAYQQEIGLQQAHVSAGQALEEADPEDEEEEEDPLFGDEDEEGGDEEAAPEEEPEEPAEEPPAEEPVEEPADDAGLEKQKAQGDAYQVKATPLDLELGKISPEGISGTLNLIRAGRSFKDADIAEQLRKYVETLSDAEQLALGTFLSAIRDIAVGETAQEAPDPSDPKVDIDISSTGEEQGQAPEGEAPPQERPAEEPVTGEAPPRGEPAMKRPESEDLEDTEAPIQVGRTQQLAAHRERDMQFRQHIRELIGG